MHAAKLIDIIEEAGFEPQSYSGRGMYGRECVGVALEKSAFSFALELVTSVLDSGGGSDEDLETLRQLSLLRTSEDQLGMGRILYWPQVEWPQEAEEAADAK